jgi:hypothetical protein
MWSCETVRSEPAVYLFVLPHTPPCFPHALTVSHVLNSSRLLDKFENINDQTVCVAYVPPLNVYWASGRFGRLLAYDPRCACV